MSEKEDENQEEKPYTLIYLLKPNNVPSLICFVLLLLSTIIWGKEYRCV